tara:strand:+ start:553 stop:765 length:213 start_codon:yes stop_codon:yes gene_type:complete
MKDAAPATCAQFFIGSLRGLEGVIAGDCYHGGEHAIMIWSRFAWKREGWRVERFGSVEEDAGELDRCDLL